MKTLIVLLTILCLNNTTTEAQIKVHYLVSSNHLMVGDSAQITPVIANAKPDSKIELVVSDFQKEVLKTNLDKFYYKAEFSGKHELMVYLELSNNNKVYFIDTQYISFYCFKMKANIYTAKKTFIAYVGMATPFELDMPGTCSNDVVISGQGVTIKKESQENSFSMTCSGEGEGQLTIALKREDGTVTVVSQIPVLKKNTPTPSIVAKISKIDSTILLNSVLNDQFIFELKNGVDSFTLVYEKEGKKISKVFSGNKIDSKTYIELMSLPKNTWIYFENIKHWVGLWGPKKYTFSNIAIKL